MNEKKILCLKAYCGRDIMLTLFTLVPQSILRGDLNSNNRDNTKASTHLLYNYYEWGIGIVLCVLYIFTFNYYNRSSEARHRSIKLLMTHISQVSLLQSLGDWRNIMGPWVMSLQRPFTIHSLQQELESYHGRWFPKPHSHKGQGVELGAGCCTCSGLHSKHRTLISKLQYLTHKLIKLCHVI